ncbi:DUF4123 domain-containing protein [Pseudomonas sp. GCM10022188]|uniref:DUF4123 domain-containing protein n=1 Tax=Pseudomonas TaxID=286 RepID=UPI001E5E4E07|nr:DUF4123 domain-containing protein [Pseudomonas oryzagri]MCC6074544.1 DUF4123 domain-containing protein [Pseudomonas oryzagri]
MRISTDNWLACLHQQAEDAKLPHLDLLIDATNFDYPLLSSLAALEPPVQLAKLFHDTPEADLAEIGPILLRLNRQPHAHQSWLRDLLASQNWHSHVLVLLSPWGFNALGRHLRHCTQAEWNNGRASGLLRYYDPRLFLAASDMLSPQQGRWFHASVIAWHWLDRDHAARSLSGHHTPHGQVPDPLPRLCLDKEQIASLQAWSAAEDYRRRWAIQPQHYGLAQQESLVRQLVHAQLAANREALHAIDTRDAFIRSWLEANSPRGNQDQPGGSA